MKRAIWGRALLLLLHILPFVGRPALIGGDEPHYALMAHSIAIDGNLELETNYAAVEQGSVAAGARIAGSRLDRHVLEHNGRPVFSHPLGLPLIVAPLLWLQNRLLPGAAPDLLLGILGLSVTFLALLEGLRLLARHAPDERTGQMIGLAVYFTTPLWFYSRTFFTEPYLWSLTVLAIGLMDRGRLLPTSLLLGLTLLIKETALLAVGPIVVWTWWHWGWKRGLQISLIPLLAVVGFCLKNLWVYGEWLVTFQPYEVGSPGRGLVGLLVDSRHGLLPFAPITLIAVFGWGLVLTTGNRRALDATRTALVIFVGFFLVSALWVDWRGGSGFGPRLMVPALPALALPLLVLMSREHVAGGLRRVFAGLAVVGFAVQWSAVTQPFGSFWSIPIGELTVGRPVAFLSGLILAGSACWFLSRPVGAEKRAARGALR